MIKRVWYFVIRVQPMVKVDKKLCMWRRGTIYLLFTSHAKKLINNTWHRIVQVVTVHNPSIGFLRRGLQLAVVGLLSKVVPSKNARSLM